MLHTILLEHGALFERRLAASVGTLLGLEAEIDAPPPRCAALKFISPEVSSAQFWRQLAAAVVIARHAKAWLRAKGWAGGRAAVGFSEGGGGEAAAQADNVGAEVAARPSAFCGRAQDAGCQTSGGGEVGGEGGAAAAPRDVEQQRLSAKAAIAGSFRKAMAAVGVGSSEVRCCLCGTVRCAVAWCVGGDVRCGCRRPPRPARC